MLQVLEHAVASVGLKIRPVVQQLNTRPAAIPDLHIALTLNLFARSRVDAILAKRQTNLDLMENASVNALKNKLILLQEEKRSKLILLHDHLRLRMQYS